MVPCGSPLAAQIGFQVANLSKDNYKSVAKELYEVPTFPNWSYVFIFVHTMLFPLACLLVPMGTLYN
jgi:hypothetical protein